MKMKKTGMGLLIPKKLRIGGVTFYQRGGQVIGRVSESMEKRSNTLPQFIQRQKMRHTTALWKMLRLCELRFTQRANAYQDFASIANGLPVVYVEKKFADHNLVCILVELHILEQTQNRPKINSWFKHNSSLLRLTIVHSQVSAMSAVVPLVS